MRKTDVKTTKKGFNITKSAERKEKEAREQRLKDKKNNHKANPTNKEIMQMLVDMADRQSEIYDILKQDTK